MEENKITLLSNLFKEYEKELFNLHYKSEWNGHNLHLSYRDRDNENEPKANKAKINRLGIMIRQAMIEIENDGKKINTY